MSQLAVAGPAQRMSQVFDRRIALRALAGMGLALSQGPRHALAHGAGGAPPWLVGETFVGQTNDPTTFIALVLGKPAGDAAQLAWAYLCDGLGHSVDTWFAGNVLDDQLALTAAGGSQVFASRNAAGIGGGATLRDGRSFTFTAQPATDIAGLYSVSLLPEGRITGASASQGVLQGDLLPARMPGEYLATLETPSEGQILGLPDNHAAQGGFQYIGLLSTPDGQSVPVQVRTATADAGQFSIIVLANGQGRGQGTATATRVWVDPQLTFIH